MTRLTGRVVTRHNSFVITELRVEDGSLEAAGYWASITAVREQNRAAKMLGTRDTTADSGSPFLKDM
jgi:hypothetical protein